MPSEGGRRGTPRTAVTKNVPADRVSGQYGGVNIPYAPKEWRPQTPDQLDQVNHAPDDSERRKTLDAREELWRQQREKQRQVLHERLLRDLHEQEREIEELEQFLGLEPSPPYRPSPDEYGPYPQGPSQSTTQECPFCGQWAHQGHICATPEARQSQLDARARGVNEEDLLARQRHEASRERATRRQHRADWLDELKARKAGVLRRESERKQLLAQRERERKQLLAQQERDRAQREHMEEVGRWQRLPWWRRVITAKPTLG